MDYTVREITKDTAKSMIVKHHYSHCWTMCDVALGVFSNEDTNEFFGDGETLIGCIVYGYPVGRQVTESISPLIKKNEILELTRLWIQDGTPKNTESFCISKSFDWLKRNRPRIKILISYADPNVGHLGKIYQATNWLYQFIDRGLTPRISFDNGKNWEHPRTVVAQYGTRRMADMVEKLPKPFWIKTDLTKHRYLYILTDRVEKRKIIKSLIHPTSKYPKELGKESEVKCYTKDDTIPSDVEEFFNIDIEENENGG